MPSIRKTDRSIYGILRRISILKVLVALIALGALFSAVAITVTSQPGFCNSCHIMNNYYASWQASKHNTISCLSCHLKPGFTGYAKGKINGLAQAVDCIVGRVGTRAQATVLDISCLRSACHNAETLNSDSIKFNNKVSFSHNKHLGVTLDGIAVSCGTCHNHSQGNQHFSVSKDACYSCHFVKLQEKGKGLAQSRCLDCHTVPQGIIERGPVTINHQDFVAYNASCENSCHRKQIEHISRVTDIACLNCHEFGRGEEGSGPLHAYHSGKEKVECFECHGQIDHGPDKTHSAVAMLNCNDCHLNTHGIQKMIYSANPLPEGQDNPKILSPMFLTHVECTGCHVDLSPPAAGMADSLGTAAKATPEACDRCHEAGTGKRYIPFWQGDIKKLYAQVLERTVGAEQKAAALKTTDAQRYAQTLAQVRSILKSVEADGSWGVHNLKYTEDLLLKANQLIQSLPAGPS